ncbi:hypothetical protein PAXRUDRAFT_28817 [Paxillus rubicundulus Ve08.2h10]|uniref:Uncharacterized protein n=1 Tax=Paxillus rubicundulus Ve08.2h10 TaxID=930991 RepID=A0A0D0DHB8_9AGAM|nr:hypothetical protein PAXRUDRAFT_28817 [Paxillus rubicundulus Ve08.2h10]
MEIFIHGIEALPDDILQAAIIEKYATAERSCYQLLLATWDLKEMKCKVHTQEQTQLHLESSHSLNKAELKYQLSIYSDHSVTDVAREDTTKLSTMHHCACSHGLDVDINEVDELTINDTVTCGRVEIDNEIEEVDDEPHHE